MPTDVTISGVWHCPCLCHAADMRCSMCLDNHAALRPLVSGPVATDPRIVLAIGYLQRALAVECHHVFGEAVVSCSCMAHKDELINESLKALRGLGED